MPAAKSNPCNYFIAKTFGHVVGALAITTASAANPVIYNEVAKVMNPLMAAIFWIFAAIISFLIIGLFPPNSPLKYAMAALSAIIIGQLSGNNFTRLENENLLFRVFFLTTGVFVAMMLVGIYDNQNFLALQSYLVATIIGLIVAELILYFIELFNPQAQANLLGLNTLLTFISVGVFSIYAVTNMQNLKDRAKSCSGQPDFIAESQGLFMTYVNLFQNISNIN
jgi:FtsH-binding integral membrane protein